VAQKKNLAKPLFPGDCPAPGALDFHSGFGGMHAETDEGRRLSFLRACRPPHTAGEARNLKKRPQPLFDHSCTASAPSRPAAAAARPMPRARIAWRAPAALRGARAVLSCI